MVIVSLIEEVLALVEGLLGHFVTGVTSQVPSMSPDYEWLVYPATGHLTSKGEFLMGAVADIATYGAILVDWLVQAMVGMNFNLNSPAN